ncbi:SLC13 family permease [Bisgaard Taxon 10/6]|uniref:SLC13 family permease n=1 Tax=Exercitatus varius TaxID=67857 RepID=A0AAW6QAF1_9PAST|nr:SLC13 family permease [Exercitatus varius]MDG2917319.1 SLC13 family permease [Exercitatus varius]MDG2946990.1 SLC13 family permease [Exercitatus varius]MDG2949108.1 SLC13 family permease [Exercitatus varius]MDG2951735.1 SLC13 family permease [Exercitatus varius]
MSSFYTLFFAWLQTPLFWVLALLVCAVYLFVRDKIRMDMVALLVMLGFCLSGILPVNEVFAGFSDPNVILVALLFVVGEGLVRTGIAYQVSDWLMRMSRDSETRVLILLMLAVAGLGAFMSSTGIVAIFIPVVLAICQQMNISPKRLMMPLSVAGLISGMMTLIATAPNLVINAELLKTGDSLSFFAFTPIGLAVLLIGVIYMLAVRRFLATEDEQHADGQGKRSLSNLIDDYRLRERTKRFVVRQNSPFIGQTVESLHLRSKFGLNILAIERWKRFSATFLAISLGKMEIREKDILLIDIGNPELDIAAFCHEQNLEPAELREYDFSIRAKSIGLAEITPVPDSDIIGKSTAEVRFRSNYGLNVVGIRRGGEVLTGHLADEAFKLGDQILVIGDWKLLRQLGNQQKEFFVLDYPAEIDRVAPAQSKSWYAIAIVLLMVVLMVSGVVPNVVAVLLACLLLGKFRCIDAKSAYDSIHWPTLILIIGMMPFSTALQKTGGVNLMVDFMLHTVGTMGKHWILISLFMLCAVVGLFISNTATAILIAPIAITMAQKLGLSPVPFAMTVAIASSAAFVTPISSPVNTMVLGPGNYKFSDFVKIGIPFTVLVMLVTVFLVPILFPF